MNTQNREDNFTLEILRAVDTQSALSQRHLSDRLGVALGLTNLYLKRCVSKGLIKIQQAPAKRYLYYLTPHGFAEKSRLTAQYLTHSFDFYRRAGESCARAFAHCEQQGWRRVLLAGVSELAEIAFLRAEERRIEIIGMVDPLAGQAQFLSRPVWRDYPKIEFDALLLTALRESQAHYEKLIAHCESNRVLVPDILDITMVTTPTSG